MSETSQLYKEEIQSTRTTLLFVVLTLVFAGLAYWRLSNKSADAIFYLLSIFAAFFLFYSINYRTLIITLSPEKVHLKFGIFKWTVPISNIAGCELDDKLPAGIEYGGAGIHFFVAHRRYRVSFNFLEYDRVVLRLKTKQGLVKDVSFSTCNADEILQIIQTQMA